MALVSRVRFVTDSLVTLVKPYFLGSRPPVPWAIGPPRVHGFWRFGLIHRDVSRLDGGPGDLTLVRPTALFIGQTEGWLVWRGRS